jgi:lipopolysaccharide transport system ATP-binding protein
LEKGKVKDFGDTGQILTSYMAALQNNVFEHYFENPEQAPGNDVIRLKYAKLNPVLQENQSYWDIRHPFKIEFEFWNLGNTQNLNVSLHVFASTGECIFNVGSDQLTCQYGLIRGTLDVPGHYLNDGNYVVSFMVVKDKSIILYNFEEIFNFEIADFREDTTWYGKWPGYVRPSFPFPLEQISETI